MTHLHDMRAVHALRWAILVAALLLAIQAPSVRASRAPRPAGSTFRDCRGCPTMVVVPAGGARLGGDPVSQAGAGTPADIAAHELPRYVIKIDRPFALGRSFVTRDQFGAFAAATGWTATGCNALDAATDTWGPHPDLNWRSPGFSQSGADPVVCVSWPDAMAYVAWLSKVSGKSYRLPSEGEYEYAARAGATGLRYWGDDPAAACAHGNGSGLERAEAYKLSPSPAAFLPCRDRFVNTSPAGAFPPNAFGLQDMLGDVWEWTADCYTFDHSGAHTDPSPRLDGDCAYHMDKGSSWVNSPHYLSAAARHRDLTDNRDTVLGFRVARDLSQPGKDRR